MPINITVNNTLKQIADDILIDIACSTNCQARHIFAVKSR